MPIGIKKCRKQFTANKNRRNHAFLEYNHPKWVVAIYYVRITRKGISTLQLSKEIGITQKSSWVILLRIRHTCA